MAETTQRITPVLRFDNQAEKQLDYEGRDAAHPERRRTRR